jgi:hypothetical protein
MGSARRKTLVGPVRTIHDAGPEGLLLVSSDRGGCESDPARDGSHRSMLLGLKTRRWVLFSLAPPPIPVIVCRVLPTGAQSQNSGYLLVLGILFTRSATTSIMAAPAPTGTRA